MSPLLWAIALLLLGCIFLILEFFVPSNGLLGFLAAGTFLVAIVFGMFASPTIGMTIFAVEVVLVPTILGLAVKYWPHTPMGRKMLIQRPENPDEVLPETEAYRSLHNLIGSHGLAKSLMLPSGVVQIDGRNYDAVGEGSAIEAGQRVVVVAISTQRLVVRTAEPTLSELATQESVLPPSVSPFEEPLEGV